MKWTLGKKFLLVIGLVVALSIGAVFFWTTVRQERFILQQVEKQARILCQQILFTRQWVSEHGGVFVEKKAGMEPNPFVEEAEVRDQEGKIYTQRNPATVTRELSELAERGGVYRFRATGLRPLNPANYPDEFEGEALRRFEREDLPEAVRVENSPEGRVYRYIVPLRLDESCMPCHRHQGYQVGDIKGGISIRIPMKEADQAILSNRWTLLFSGLAVMAAVVCTLYLLMRRLVIWPVRQLKEQTERIGGGEGVASPPPAWDEVESLKAAFREMDRRLGESRDHLEEKVRAATRDLEDANLKLQELDRLKSDFVSHVSHELRTPLTAIRGAVDYLLRQNGGAADFLEIIKKNTERLIRLVTDLLDLSRIEAGKMELQLDSLHLSFLVEEVAAFVGNTAHSRGVEIRIGIPESLWVIADEDRIKQVFINLLSNAMKFSPPGGTVEVFAEEGEQEVRVGVRDRGPGIAPEDRDKIFGRFQQVGHPPGGPSGAGLGLAIAKGIVEAHGGRISVESGESAGSTFYFTLPRRNEGFGS